jgi:hypothetical protein
MEMQEQLIQVEEEVLLQEDHPLQLNQEVQEVQESLLLEHQELQD